MLNFDHIWSDMVDIDAFKTGRTSDHGESSSPATCSFPTFDSVFDGLGNLASELVFEGSAADTGTQEPASRLFEERVDVLVNDHILVHLDIPDAIPVKSCPSIISGLLGSVVLDGDGSTTILTKTLRHVLSQGSQHTVTAAIRNSQVNSHSQSGLSHFKLLI